MTSEVMARVILWRVLEIEADADGLLDDPLHLRVRGGGGQPVLWRARLRDDDGRVWRAEAPTPEELTVRWRPAKPQDGRAAALGSLHPVRIDVRAEVDDGRGASRTITRRLLADGVRVRRWRDGAPATLHLPSGPPAATLLLDATADAERAVVAALAGALLASRGALVLVVARGRGKGADTAAALDGARARLAAVPGADPAGAVVLPVLAAGEAGDGVVLPAGVGLGGEADPAARAAAWRALVARLGLAGA